MTTAAGRRLCQACTDGLFGKVASMLATPDRQVATVVGEAAKTRRIADKVRRRRSARG